MDFRILVVITALLLFSGCGEESVSPDPTLSQDEREGKNLDKESDNILQEDNISTDTFENNLSIGQANISSIDENGTISLTDANMSKAIKEIPPTLIDEDIDYINTQFESIYFDYDRYSIKEKMLVIVNKNIQLMNAQQVLGNKIIIEGNCDEWGTDEYNYALGLKRAQVIRETFIAEGITESRVRIVTFGESNPICLEQKDDCWAKNRRVDFKLEK